MRYTNRHFYLLTCIWPISWDLSPCRTSRLFGRGKEPCWNRVAWVYAAIAFGNHQVHILSFPDEQKQNTKQWYNIPTITHYICFPHQEPGCGMALSHRDGSVQLLTIFSCFISFGPRYKALNINLRELTSLSMWTVIVTVYKRCAGISCNTSVF